MSKQPPYTITSESITVVWEGKPHVVQKGSVHFIGLRKAIMEEMWDDIPNHLTVSKGLKAWAEGKFTINDNVVSYEGEPVPKNINNRIISMAASGEDPRPLFKFWARLKKNPSYRSVTQLFDFIQHDNIPITDDGCFYAYKAVRSDYKDVHSGKFDNSPGSVHEMPRNQISDDPTLACHIGFHVGSLNYARGFHSGGQLVVCKVDPENVVCVPHDSSSEKMRVCRYEVIGNYGSPLPSTIYVKEEEEDTDDPGVEGMEDEDSDDVDENEDGVEDNDTDLDDDDTEEEVEDSEDEEAGDPLSLEECRESGTHLTSVDSDGYCNVCGEQPSDEDIPADTTAKEEPKEVKKAPKKKEKKTSKTFSKKTKDTFPRFAYKKMEDLMKESIEDLRKYAANNLKVIGASKIPGGKVALVATIIKVRK